VTVAADGTFATSLVLVVGSNTVQVVAVDGYGLQTTQTLSVVLDQTPPVITISGVTDGEFSNAASLNPSFTASDANLLKTTATLDGANFISGSPVSAEGLHKLVVTAIDRANNQASMQVSFTIDHTPPALSLPPNMTVDATSPAGAVVRFTATANDNIDGAVSVTCNPASGSTFPTGTTNVACAANDRAGNISRGTFSITVNGPLTQLMNLFPKVEALAASLGVPTSVVRNWERQLQTIVAAGASPTTCSAFNTLAAAPPIPTGTILTPQQTAQLNDIRAALTNIGAAMGC
jgi:hypothetical protein